jgi:hypothetical protein
LFPKLCHSRRRRWPHVLLGDVVLSFYLGASQTQPSDLHVVQPNRGNDATIHDVQWPGYPFRFEPYYGLRLSYNAPGHPQTRIVLDFTHYKIYALANQVVEQDGTWHGKPLHAAAPMRENVQSFEVTHGLNTLGLSLLQNIWGGSNGAYIGGGPVLYVPHSENRVDGIAGGDRYGFATFGFQAHAGVRGCVSSHGLFAEAKYNSGKLVMPIAEGTAQTTVRTMHELAGFDFSPSCR